MEYIVRILSTKPVTHNVKRFRVEKPSDYTFTPGQATDVAINKPEWKKELRPFTFTCLPGDPYLEFTIKRYPDRKGVTNELHQLKEGDELILHDVWGAIEYKGPGCFIAGGAGITPFLAILRNLKAMNKLEGNMLFFSNQTQADIICEAELKDMLGENAMFVLSKENRPGYIFGRIDKDFLHIHLNNLQQEFYICGPDAMVLDIMEQLTALGAKAEGLVFEK
ncbi:MAG TPA: FAD-binding oxidoreductase [Chitinophagaceae bacterium]|nr:FAD-binding oxidoreductase [Chitinophagaceae bacterium]